MNQVIMLGRLTKKPEQRYTQSGKVVVSFSIAVDRRFKTDDGPEADFFNCTVWGKTGEALATYCDKGSKILISGSVQNDTYTNKDGQKVTATKINVDSWEFAESKKAQQSSHSDSGFVEVENEGDLPFN